MKLLLTKFAIDICGLNPTLQSKSGTKWLLHFTIAPFSLIFICVMVCIGICYEHTFERTP